MYILELEQKSSDNLTKSDRYYICFLTLKGNLSTNLACTKIYIVKKNLEIEILQ